MPPYWERLVIVCQRLVRTDQAELKPAVQLGMREGNASVINRRARVENLNAETRRKWRRVAVRDRVRCLAAKAQNPTPPSQRKKGATCWRCLLSPAKSLFARAKLSWSQLFKVEVWNAGRKCSSVMPKMDAYMISSW